MNIFIYASELSVITGHNNYQSINDIYMKLWKKHFPEDYNRIKELLGQVIIEESTEEYVNRIAKENNISSELNECLESKDIDNLSLAKNKILNNIDKIKSPKEKNLFRECVQNLANTNFGTQNENIALQFYIQKTGDNVNKIEKFLKRPLYQTKNNVWFIGGRIDGINENGTIIEIKNRVKKLFYNLRDYEKIQAYAYMFIMEKRQAKLVESLKKENVIEMNIIDIEFALDFWVKEIDVKIRKFIKSFEKFMKDDKKKIELINVM